jgi:hypothetical protein
MMTVPAAEGESSMTRLRVLALTIAVAAALAACSNNSSTAIPPASAGSNHAGAGGESTTTTLSPAAEYRFLIAPVRRAEAAFKATRTFAGAEAAAGPFASALTTWSQGLSSYNWPPSVKPDVQALISTIPAEVADLNAIAGGDTADIPKAATDGAPVTAAALKVSRDLGLSG